MIARNRTKSVIAFAVAAALAPAAFAQQGQQDSQWQRDLQQWQQGAGQQPGNTTVGAIRGEPLFYANGQRVGTILNVVQNARDDGFLVVRRDSDGQRVLAPFNQMLWRDGRFTMVDGARTNLEAFTEDNADNYDRLRAGHRVRVANYIAGGQATSADGTQANYNDNAGAQAQRTSSAEGADILVRQATPRIRVEQAQPTVRVEQPEPHVSVQQPKPEIIVRQPPPTITVQQQQPEIVVRMPDPNVNVAMPEPNVNVRVPPPQVRFAQPNREAVDVQRAEANVQVVPPQQQAQIDVNRSEPNIRFERTGEPQVRYQEAEGEPQIRYERVGNNAQQGQGGVGGTQGRGGAGQRQGGSQQQ